MVLDMFLLYNLTEFLRALAYCLSKAFALCGSSFLPLRKLELAYNPTELIGELQFTNWESLLHDDMTEPRSLDFLRKCLYFLVSSHLPSPMGLGRRWGWPMILPLLCHGSLRRHPPQRC